MPIKLIRDKDRSPAHEMQELVEFAREHPDLRPLEEALVRDARARVEEGSYITEEAYTNWRLYYDRAGQLWRRLYGYTPLVEARVMAASARARAEHTKAVLNTNPTAHELRE